MLRGFLGFISSVFGLVGVMISVSPSEAKSTFSLWLSAIGIENVPEWASSPDIDRPLQLLFFTLGLVFLTCLLFDIYWRKRKSAITVNRNNYSVFVGTLYDDLILTWSSEGIKSRPHIITKVHTSSRAALAFTELDNLCKQGILPKKIDIKLRKFVGFFSLSGDTGDTLFSSQTIKTRFNTLEELNAKKREILSLKKQLTKMLYNVRYE